jgi:eukaryotic-like serine/threonine-protein kinase
MGTPTEFVENICSELDELEDTRAMTRADEETLIGKKSTIHTPILSPSGLEHSMADFDQLMERYEVRQQNPFVGWSCQYRKGAEIGKGSQGVVYDMECEEAFFGHRALKIMNPNPYRDAALYRKEMERMKEVAAVVHQICHGNLILVERFESDGGIYMMVMRQMVEGYNLLSLLMKSKKRRLERFVSTERMSILENVLYSVCSDSQCGLKPGVAVYIIENCLRGVGALHAKGITHCDLKPSNIMIDHDGSIKLIDISSAYKKDAPPYYPSWTPLYAPPEVLEDKPWTAQSDQASLGYVLIEMLSGRPEFESLPAGSEFAYALDPEAREKLLESKRTLPDRVCELIPSDIQKSQRLMALITKLIDPNPGKRYPSADEAIEHCVKFQADLIRGNYGMIWDYVIKFWLRDIIAAPLLDDELHSESRKA